MITVLIVTVYVLQYYFSTVYVNNNSIIHVHDYTCIIYTYRSIIDTVQVAVGRSAVVG